MREDAGVEGNNGRWVRMAILTVGYGLYTAWEFVVREPLSFYADGVWVSMWGPIFLLCALTFLGLAFAQRMGLNINLWGAPVGVGSAIAMGLVTVLALASVVGNHVLVAFCAAFLTGVCIPMFLCRWAQCFLSLGIMGATGCMIASELIAGGVALLASSLKGWGLWIAVSVIVVGANAALWFLSRGAGLGVPVRLGSAEGAGNGPTTKNLGSARASKFFAALLFVYGIVALLFRVMFSGATQLPLFSIALVSLAVAVFLAVPVLLSRIIGFGPLYALLIGLAAILALGYLLGGILGIDMAGHLFLMCIRAGFVAIFVVLVSLSTRVSNSRWLSVFATGWGLLYLGFAFGGFLGGAVVPAFRVPNAVLYICCLVVLGLLAICLLLTPRVDAKLLADCGRALKGSNGELPGPLLESHQEKENPLVDSCIWLGSNCQMTPREIEVFSLLAEGRDTRYIESVLSIARDTVKMHRKSIYRKLDVHSQQELIELARGKGARGAKK